LPEKKKKERRKKGKRREEMHRVFCIQLAELRDRQIFSFKWADAMS